MKKYILPLLFFIFLFNYSCQKELNITDFEDDFGNYGPELKIEGLLQQDTPENSIVRIIKSSPVTEAEVFNGQDDDGDGEVDEYDETLPLIQDTTAIVKVHDLNSGKTWDFEYVAAADSFIYEEDFERGPKDDEDFSDDIKEMVIYGAYKPSDPNFDLQNFNEYRLEVDSRDFDQLITATTKVYPAVAFIDTLHTFSEDTVYIKSDERKELYWKSDLDIASYYVTYEEIIRNSETEFLFSYNVVRDNDLTKKYGDVSIGKETLFGISPGIVLKLTVEAFSPEYGHYIFSSLPLNDPQRSNLRDQDGAPVMGCFGAIAARSIYIKFVE
jgi:hypothetical protein